jgi:small subunit ribosomal protein S2e
MADAAGRGGFGSRGGAAGDRGRGGRGGRGRGRGRRGAGKNEEKEWQPVTKLGRLVKAGKIKSMEEIYLHSLPIKEYQIVDTFLPTLKDEVMKVSAEFFCLGGSSGEQNWRNWLARAACRSARDVSSNSC